MIKTDELPSLPIESMNIIHQEELAFLNALIERTEKDNMQGVSTAFDALLKHMQQHFKSEEKIMREAQYPSFRMHKADHDKVLNEARYVEMEWRNRKNVDALREYLEEDIVPWLEQHIKAMDTPMADFASQFEKYKGY